LPVDALLVYDVQDEAARNGNARPFPFIPKVDPLEYAYDELQIGALPRVVYRAVAEQNEAGLRNWLDRLQARGGLTIFVGPPSRHSCSSLTLPGAYSLCRSHVSELCFGGVLIPERHQATGTEDARVLAKMKQGCRFFVSQTVWSARATKRLLHDLRVRAELEGVEVPPVLLTFSPCGSAQTLQFQEWLGVDVPAAVQRDLLSARDMLARSVELAIRTFAEVRDFAAEQGLEVGCNVESVSSRVTELEASEELVRRIDELLTRGDPAPHRTACHCSRSARPSSFGRSGAP